MGYDPYDYDYEQPATLEEDGPSAPRKRKTSGAEGFYNIMTGVFVMATVLVCGYVALLMAEPAGPYNPFPPGGPFPTPTLIDLDAIGTEVASKITPSPTVPIPTETPMPTLTNTPFPTPTVVVTAAVGLTNTPAANAFVLQDDQIIFTQNANDDECQWQSIAGQVFDDQDKAVQGLPVQIRGDNFEEIQFTGSASGFGPAGYEIQLGTTPIVAEYEVQLLNTTGMALSEPVIVRTSSSCQKNVAIVNFVQSSDFRP